MATLLGIKTEIVNHMHDPDITEDEIDAVINKGLIYIASKVLLTLLESYGEATTATDDFSIDIPAGWSFHRGLFDCQIDDAPDVIVLKSIEDLNRIYPDFRVEQLAGEVEYVLRHNDTVIYYPIPATAVTLNCGFYTLPTVISADGDIPECLPPGMQEELLINYTCWKLYKEIEDGFEGYKVNTAEYKKDFNTAMEDLEVIVKSGQSTNLIRRDSGWV